MKSLYQFGSAVRYDFKPESDIDFVVDFNEVNPLIYTELYFGFKSALEKLFSRTIDLIEERGIRNPYFRKELDVKKIQIYG